jgi:hypothetical protein
MESQNSAKSRHFYLDLAHNNILTGDNLKKKGWEGPTRCPLCCLQEESANHLLLSCPFAKEVWNLALFPWSNQVTLPDEIPILLSNWDKLCPFTLHKKDRLKICWMTLPKLYFLEALVGTKRPPLQRKNLHSCSGGSQS